MTNTALSPKQRLKLLERVFKKGESVTSACREFGVSRFTFYKWAKRYDPKASRNQNLKNLVDLKKKVAKSPKLASSKVIEEVKKIASVKPHWSKYKIADELKKRLGGKAVGVHGVYNVLKRSGLNTLEARREWQRFVLKSYKRVLTPEQRLEVIKKAEDLRISVVQVCRDFGISRYTFYKWKKRWEESGKKDDALRDRLPQFDRRHLRVRQELEKEILSIVIELPNLSKYGIARKIAEKLGPVVGPHGVYNVLLRNGLNRPEERLAYSNARAPEVAAPETWTDRLRYVLEQFVPTLAPAPPPGISTIFSFLRTFSIATILSSATIYSFLWWINLLASQIAQVSIGLVFASVALFMGSLFFLYSLKYYITLAIVLSFSQQDPATSSTTRGKRGFVSWLLGLRDRESSAVAKEEKKSIGLTPNLEHITLKRHPLVSVHIPLFNEKRVVERILRAATTFDYPNYEVILADDSTDETTRIIQDYILKSSKQYVASRNGKNKSHATNYKLHTTKGEGWTMTQAEVRPGVILKHLHRTTRSGYKGGALRLALRVTDPKTEFVSVFDADFVPYPDTLELFLKYFQATAGTLDFRKAKSLQSTDYSKEKAVDDSQKAVSNPIAAVQGYQWHVLNKSENWITRGVRSEYAGSYVIERSGGEIYGGLKQISGAVYMIRKDVLQEVGWDTSITEDFQLTLKLYEKGYKVVYTPYIQAPAECVSTLKRLIRQRMRWSEGHSNNIKKMFSHLIFNKNLSIAERLEFLYLSPYYLQAFFFLVGTLSWLISETFFPARLPFWTSLWGWSLVLTNVISLPLMNAVGLFLEESEERDYQGVISFVVLTYILVPFQAYAAVKGFLEKEEGPWFRTPKTGLITDVFTRGRFYRFISGILPGRSSIGTGGVTAGGQLAMVSNRSLGQYLALATANNQFNTFKVNPKKARWIGKATLAFSLSIAILLVSLSPFIRSGVETLDNTPGQKIPELSAERNDFRIDENPEFILDIGVDDSKEDNVSWVPLAQAAESQNIETVVYYNDTPVDLPVEVDNISSGKLSIKLNPIDTLKPGKYTLKTFVGEEEQRVVSTQDFTWGVLAINTNKSIYLQGETANLSFAVLDDSGEMVCDASLKLSIYNSQFSIKDELSTKAGTIKINEECSKKQKTAKPDYEGKYLVGEPGVYSLELFAETHSGERLIKDSFEVRNFVSFDIERFSPTRIFPADNYTVSLKVKANEDFKGQVIESIPESFDIIRDPRFSIHDSQISWNVNWIKGQTYELSYVFNAPNISPAFYLLGPLRLVDTRSGLTRFEELRKWQIASDTTNLLINASTTGSTDAPATWGDITGLTGSATVNGTGSVLILIAHVPHVMTSTHETAEHRFTIDGSATGSPILTAFMDNTDEGNAISMVWAVDNLSAASHDFAVQWQQVTGVSQTDASRTRSFQVIEIEDNASIIIDQSNSAGSADPATWANIPSLSATVTPTASSLHLFIADIQPDDTSDASSDIQFAVAGTRDGPMSSLFTDGVGIQNGTGLMWAETGLAASSQTLSIQWQARTGSLVLDTARPSIFQVVEVTANFSLPVDVEVSSSDTSDGTYNIITGMSGSATPNASDSVMLFFGAGVMLDGSDAGADLRLADDGTLEGAEITTFRDASEELPGYLLARAKTGITGSHTFSLQWTTRGAAIGTDTGRERTFQVVDFETVSTDVSVSSIGNQVTTMTITSTDNNVGASGAGGGAFVITENTSSRNVLTITITENGTVDGLNDVDNIRLYSENDTSTPYNCASESFSGFPTPSENQYGSTDTTGFSAADGTSLFTETVAISTTSTLCVYVVVDITSGASDDETLLIEIDTPNTQVTVDGSGSVGPTSSVLLSGSTELQTPLDLDQEHFRWRNDNGGESGGSSPQVTQITDTTTSNSSDEPMADMSITPGAGDYLIWFTTSVESSATNRRIFVSIYVGGSPLAHTEREVFVEGSYDSSSFVVNTHARRLSVGATDEIEIYWRFTGGSGQATAHERTLTVEEITSANTDQASATGNDTRSVDTYALMGSMTRTPGAGDYLIWFSGSIETDSSTAVTLVSIFVGGAPETHTERQLNSDSSYADASVPIATHARRLSVGASDTIEVHWRTSAGTATVHERTLVVKRVNSGNSDQASATLDDTHNTDSWILMDTMTRTPGAGDYLVWFSGSVESNTGNTTTLISIFVGGTQVTHTERETFTDGSGTNYPYPGVSTHALLTGVGASEAIEIQWRTSSGIATVHERTLVIFDMFVQHEATLTGSSNTQDFVTVASVASAVDELYLASIAIYEELAEVSTVTGGGLTWTRQKRQCADRIDEPSVEVWQAFGTPSSTFTASASADIDPSRRLSMAVSRYSGTDKTNPTEGADGSNTAVDSTCDLSGTDTDSASLSISTTIDDSMIYIATHPRNGSISTADADYTQRAFISNSSGGDGANLYIHDRNFATAGTDSADHTLAATKPWDMVGLAINPMNFGAAATFAKDEDTKFIDFPRNTTYRLRFMVFNQGGQTSGNVTYRIQVAQTATCSSGSYADVPTDGSGHWDIVDSTNITDGEATSNISPGLTDPGAGTFKAGELRDNTSNTTGTIVLIEDEFTEIEFALEATNNSIDATNYCFRLFDTTGSTPLDTYTKYGEALIVPEYTWLFFGLGPLLPGFIGRMRRRKK